MWQPIETAPRDFVTEIDMWAEGRFCNCLWVKIKDKEPCWCYGEDVPNWGWEYFPVPNPTHWMPLPKPPIV